MSHKNIAFFVPHAGCPNLCSFCNQRSISGAQAQPLPEDIKSVCRQALSRISDPRNAEIAFFGGSFTAIEESYRLALLEAVQEFIGADRFSGIRISTRPDAVSEAILTQLKFYHVTSIELGAQSMADAVLRANDRGHTAQDVRRASRLIKAYGFELGLQMMTGLYTSDAKLDFATAEELLRLHPETVRIYPTVILEGTRLAEYFRQGRYMPMETDEAVSLCAKILRLFTENGINVIRVGLHASEAMEKQRIAGVYHPAFRELCEGWLFREEIEKALAGRQGHFKVDIPENSISKVVGQKQSNRIYFEQAGAFLKFQPSRDIEGYHIRLKEEV